MILMANLGAVIDQILHPEIDYFDHEHLIVGGVTAFVVGVVTFLLIIYITRLEKAYYYIKQKEETILQSEEKYRLLIENSHDIIYTFSAEGNFIFVSSSWTQLLGHEVANVEGRHFSQFIHPDDLPKCNEWMQKLINSGQRQSGLEYRVKHLDGTWYWHTSNVVSLKDPSGKVISYEGVAHDITATKQTEQELSDYRIHLEEIVKIRTEKLNIAYNEITKQLEKEKDYQVLLQKSLEKEIELSKMKSNLISTTSHEFRTPLTSILSSTELLQRYGEKWSNDKKNEHVDRIRRKVDYLTKLLDDVLLISESDAGKLSNKPSNVNLKYLLQDCIDDSKSLLSESHNLILNYLCEREDFIMDEKLIRFAVSNLLSNAIKYSPNGGDVILVASSSHKSLSIKVSDQGIGIHKDEVDSIFESFNRASNAKSFSGNGLGLTIVKRTIDLLRGDILVTSQLGKGTTITVTIPVV